MSKCIILPLSSSLLGNMILYWCEAFPYLFLREAHWPGLLSPTWSLRMKQKTNINYARLLMAPEKIELHVTFILAIIKRSNLQKRGKK